MIFGKEDIQLIYSTYEMKDNDKEFKKRQTHYLQTYIKNKPPGIESEIDLVLLKESSFSKRISKADALLVVIEIGSNHIKYDLYYSPKSKLFWHLVTENKSFGSLLENYNSNKLKQIWNTISHIPQRKLIEFIKGNQDIINVSCLK